MNLFELKDASETNQQCFILTKRIKIFCAKRLNIITDFIN